MACAAVFSVTRMNSIKKQLVTCLSFSEHTKYVINILCCFLAKGTYLQLLVVYVNVIFDAVVLSVHSFYA